MLTWDKLKKIAVFIYKPYAYDFINSKPGSISGDLVKKKNKITNTELQEPFPEKAHASERPKVYKLYSW